MSKEGRILSGMRPTGKLHLGNYEGALRNWTGLQHEYECFFEVADWHALTTAWKDTGELRSFTRGLVIDWLSAGLDPDHSVIFVQSSVSEHAELQLLFSMFINVGALERSPTYKEWISEGLEPNFGLLGYPVLQAADILIYQADTVPVGKDQLPHLELTREIARKFNRLYGEVFPEPKAKLTEFPNLPGIDGRKMSKSYDNHIYISEGPDDVVGKVRRFFTDPEKKRKGDPGRPEICPVFALREIYNPSETETIAGDCRSGVLGCVDCKMKLSDELNEMLEPIRARRADLERRPTEVDDVLNDGNKRAKQVAKKTMANVREAMRIG